VTEIHVDGPMGLLPLVSADGTRIPGGCISLVAVYMAGLRDCWSEGKEE